MNFDAILRGAQGGLAIGALVGLIPLGVGFLCRERRKALAGFLGCVFGGFVGGIVPAIAIMAMTTAQIVRPGQQTEERTSEWSGLATVTDKVWYLAGMCWFCISTIGTMFVSAAYLSPLVLGEPNSATRASVGKVVEPLMLFGGMGIGLIIGVAGLAFICRRFLSSTTHSNWAKDLEVSTMNRSPFLQKIARYYGGLLLPRGWPGLTKQ